MPAMNVFQIRPAIVGIATIPVA
ncbi:hypothetical protein E2C01_093623 [Portunus trituberculatus]|uniref:Uncharacterized protein n=1 Tax=Portunus trituberculatus TaxID=210409 RepID=A0A5B7JQA2_PORTR|nr:hypothetical protein [Portunus trituberculatus]